MNRLEKAIISCRILFKKITIMPKGQTPKLKGSICNVPVNTSDVVHTLPQGADSNGILMVILIFLRPSRTFQRTLLADFVNRRKSQIASFFSSWIILTSWANLFV